MFSVRACSRSSSSRFPHQGFLEPQPPDQIQNCAVCSIFQCFRTIKTEKLVSEKNEFSDKNFQKFDIEKQNSPNRKAWNSFDLSGFWGPRGEPWKDPASVIKQSQSSKLGANSRPNLSRGGGIKTRPIPAHRRGTPDLLPASVFLHLASGYRGGGVGEGVESSKVNVTSHGCSANSRFLNPAPPHTHHSPGFIRGE